MTGNHSRPRFFAFVGTLLVFLLVNLICALPLFCFEKSYERKRESSSYLSKYLSCIYSPPFIEHQVSVITTYIEGNSIFVLGPAETKFMGGEIYQPLKRNISLKRFHCFAFFLEPLSRAPTFEILSPVSPEWIFLRIFSSKVSRFNDAILCKREYSNIIIIL